MRVGERNKEPTTGERWIDGWMEERQSAAATACQCKVEKCVVEGWMDGWMDDGWNGLSYLIHTV